MNYDERPNSTAVTLNALAGLRVTITQKLFLQSSAGGVVLADAWCYIAESVIGNSPADDLSWSAQRKMRYA